MSSFRDSDQINEFNGKDISREKLNKKVLMKND